MSIEILDKLEFLEVINDNPNLKTITILAKDIGNQELKGIIIIRKDAINENFKPNKNFGLNLIQQTFVNNEQSKYAASSDNGFFDSMNVEIIYPAAEWQIKKYSRKTMSIFTESRDDQDKYTKVQVDNIPAKSKQWLYDVLEGKKEQETIQKGVFNANNNTTDPVDSLSSPENVEDLNSKFIIAKDYKWTDESNLSLLYQLAMPLRRDLLSIRDLRSEHLPLLKAMRLQGINVCRSKNLSDENVAMYLHQLPTFWHLHVHITHTDMMFESAHIARCILLDDVIDHLEMDDQQFVKKSFKISMFKEHPLYKDIKENQGPIDKD